MEPQEQVTVLVHGTFANPPAEPDGPPPSRWWRVTEPGLTADRLRQALAVREPALAATVWEPGGDERDGDLTYEQLVEWSSANKHTHRVKAARHLTDSLRTLADRRGCTPEHPLHVNYVAHSHGGNVVLESFKHLGRAANVRPRQVSLLGTPLTWRYTDPRYAYLTILLFFVAGWVVADIEFLFQGGRQTDPEALTLGEELVISALLLIGLLWVAFGVIRLLRRFFDGRHGRPAYGPPPEKLRELLGDRPVVLFISAEDEADLMLQLGAAPLDTYRALIRGRPVLRGVGALGAVIRLPFRLLEVLVLRPFSYAILVPLVEVLLERFALGFPFRSVMRHNYEMMTWTRRTHYGEAMVKVEISAEELERGQHEAEELLQQLQTGPQAPAEPAAIVTEQERLDELRSTLLATVTGLREQVHLSHAGYYQAQSILDEVATLIAAEDEEVDTVIAQIHATEATVVPAPPPMPPGARRPA